MKLNDGLIAALQYAVDRQESTVRVRSDSQLLVRQMTGEYRVKHPGLLPLYQRARELAHRVGRVEFQHVPRERNKDADRLANDAMDRAG